ncbi:MAG TPA: ORF6N domain-containing protein [Bryobacteraceae bacterium]|jgi:hypothetical protein|nr:ORF6N domain-containing protein [Bryobacteraceae bacterium]
MKNKKTNSRVSVEIVQRQIFMLRGCRVMLSSDLAELYQVEPRAIMQAVKRNAARFPGDFMFQIEDAELELILKSQIVISSWGGARRARPYAFTEQGVAMLSSVLRSRSAVEVNIAIMRAFVRVRRVITAHPSLAKRIGKLERTLRAHDAQFTEYKDLFETLRKFLDMPPDQAPLRKPRYGFPTAKALTTTAR